jgi:hypothetical protein
MELEDNLIGTDKGVRAAMNVLRSHVIDCLNRLNMLGNDMESVSLFLRGFVDWKMDMRNMLEEVCLKQLNDIIEDADECSQKHLENSYVKMEGLLDGVTGVLAKENKDIFELVAKGNAFIRDLMEKSSFVDFLDLRRASNRLWMT